MQGIVEKISAEGKLPRDEVLRRIDEKRAELSHLVSEEGAAIIVARELGIPVTQQTLRLENVVPGMQNVEVVAKIMRLTPARGFVTKHGEGRVQNLLLADESGSLKMSLWNEEIDKFSLREGDVMRVRGYVKDSDFGPELRLGRSGAIEKSDQRIDATRYARRQIAELQEGAYASVRAPLVQVFESNIFFEVCPQCGSRLRKEDGRCAEHGDVAPEHRLVVTGIIDDGSASMRAVFFGEHAEALLGMASSEAKKIFDRKMKVSAVLEAVPLGKEFVFEGRARRNKLFDRMEFIVSGVSEVDVKREIRSLLGE